jgi:hypothetical protein
MALRGLLDLFLAKGAAALAPSHCDRFGTDIQTNENAHEVHLLGKLSNNGYRFPDLALFAATTL